MSYSIVLMFARSEDPWFELDRAKVLLSTQPLA
jgi:hypothetical protein